jgi:D-alanyl-D-alanine carboxypeptidase/D-alanyl-D-alanine-endopeptidase (penicillin-binding protein 4)
MVELNFMMKCWGFTRWALGTLLLLGACANGADVPAVAVLQAPPAAVAPASASQPPAGPVPADVVAPDNGGELAALGPSAGPGGHGGVTPIAASEADASVDEILSDLKSPPEAPAPSRPVLAPDWRTAAAVVAARPPGTAVGYLLIDLDSGQALAELNPDLPLIPASTAKLATAVVALDVLGPEHRFRTELLARGAIDRGVLHGDLILRGGGDPLLDVADLLGLAVRLENSGIREVAGRFLIDDTALPRFAEIEPTQPPEAPYNPGIGALSVAFNRVHLAWWGGGQIDAAALPPLYEASFEPAPPSLLPPGGVALKRKGEGAVVWRVADRGRRRQLAELPVKDAGLHAGYLFRQLAGAQGISLGPPLRGVAPADAVVVAVHESVPLRYLLQDMLVYSNNMMAELIGLATAQRLGDAWGGLDAAGRLMLGHLARLMPEVDWSGAALGNLSGLDGTARLTPRQLAAIARYGWQHEALPALLPGGGWSGTLTRRFTGAGEALRVWAKTGTLNYGSALAGYLFPTTDRPAVFVTMVADTGKREAYDALLPYPGPSARAAAGAWLGRARGLQDALVESWLQPMPTS